MVVACTGLLFAAWFHCGRDRLVRNGARKATLDHLRDYADKRCGNSDARTGGPIYYFYRRLLVAGSYRHFFTPAPVYGDTSSRETGASFAALKKQSESADLMRNVYA